MTADCATIARLPDVVALSSEDLTDGCDAVQRTYADTGLGETIILDGAGVTVRVNRGELVCTDGVASHRRERRVDRSQAAAGQLRRVVVLGDGMVTTEAIGWCHALGVALVVCDSDGGPLLVGGPRLYQHGSLAKAQALAVSNDTGMAVVHALLERRLADQARISRDQLHRDDRAAAITDLRAALTHAASPTDAMIIEMQAAEHYWAAWRDEVRLSFAAKDRRRVPTHWTRFGARSSPLTEAAGNRHAATPTNAMINYGMRLAEIETTIACHGLGLDPYSGLCHADQPHRPAFVLDLMEPVRGVVEETIWSLTVTRTFRKADFAETHTGQVRLLAPFSHELAGVLLPAVRLAVGPLAEQVAQTLLRAQSPHAAMPTVLSRHRTKQARAKRGDQARSRRQPTAAASRLWTCPQCGQPVTDSRRVRCAACVDADPRQSAEIRSRRGQAIAARKRANQQWETSGGDGEFDPAAWPQIHASIRNTKLSDIMNATGLSKSFASAVRAGKSRPHVSHWATLSALGASPTLTRPA